MRPPSLRQDAQAHRARLLDAADHVFSEHGVHAALELVTEQAGVSRATLYRNFPDRGALMASLLERAFEGLEQRATALSDRADGLFALLGQVAELVASSAPVADHWRAVGRGGAVLIDARRRFTRLLRPLLSRAIASGACRADLKAGDLLLVVSMLGAGLQGRTPAERRTLSRRGFALVLDGLRADPVDRALP